MNIDTSTSMKDRLTRATIRAIEERRGVSGLSLRGIAKEAGCSHVNVYHHADGLVGLFWLAYVEALEAFSDACQRGISERGRGESFGSALARAMVAFALEREGLYRLLWFEDLRTEPRGEALETIAKTQKLFAATAFEAFRAEGLNAEEHVLSDRLQMLFALLQGEVAMLINGRAGSDRAAAGELVSERAERMWKLLLAS
ncbi:MAG: TetR/AcrR family transcriptional regulator [Spirochaetes bacterium]|nr:TetR/AcrR family transcriptional regulator [Spirochaetota bacterium]MBU1080565.1 TetR/AcrR family transcriptional regulator [Spirochaetota bacterium]